MVVRIGVAELGRLALFVIAVELRPEHRLGGHRPHRRPRIQVEVVEAGGLRAGALVGFVWDFGGLCHQSMYLATGGAGAGPSTVNHLRYNVFHVPSRRTRSSVPLTNRTSPVSSRFTPI